ncbi:MAG: hypothetical protein K1X74_03075 [Pirellulales bacterium]|nr:hypothetical protein [Pirellulales bacterium]
MRGVALSQSGLFASRLLWLLLALSLVLFSPRWAGGQTPAEDDAAVAEDDASDPLDAPLLGDDELLEEPPADAEEPTADDEPTLADPEPTSADAEAEPEMADETPADEEGLAEDAASDALPDDAPPALGSPLPARGAKTSRSGESADDASGDEADPMQSGSSEAVERVQVEVAEFNGLRPGESFVADVEKLWGRPKNVERQSDGEEQWNYEIEPFPSVVITIFERRVEAIVINLAEPFPADEVERQLGLTDVVPALVRDELGDPLGQAYPERGVLLSFDGDADTPRVVQVILEPVAPELFAARAEDRLELEPSAALDDLDQALKLDPRQAKALRLRARVLADAGRWTECLEAAQAASQREPQEPFAHLLLGLAHAHLGDNPTAVKQTKIAVKLAGQAPEIRARAFAQLGDLQAAATEKNFQQAIDYHLQAIKAAEPLLTHERQAARDEALRALIDGHLGAAYDVAWGNWQRKSNVATMWLDRAMAYVEASELTEAQALEFQLHIARAALSAIVGLQQDAQVGNWTSQATTAAKHLLAGSRDPIFNQRVQWQLGRALYDSLQIAQMRGEQEAALEFGQLAVKHMEAALADREPEATQDYLLGRLYFRLGSIYAVHVQDHLTAVEWYDKALPRLTGTLPPGAAVDLGRHGEAMVSMAVSLWEVGRADDALKYTLQGAELMEQAVGSGELNASALAVPYGNLANMHTQLGDRANARKYEKLARDPRRAARE